MTCREKQSGIRRRENREAGPGPRPKDTAHRHPLSADPLTGKVMSALLLREHLAPSLPHTFSESLHHSDLSRFGGQGATCTWVINQGKLQPGAKSGSARLCKWSSAGTQPRPSHWLISQPGQQRGLVATEPVWPTKPKILTL